MNLTPDQLDYTKIPLVFNVYKPAGPSSFSVVHHFKKNLSFDFGKIGHFGTLDPFAEGVLLIGIQGAQKLNDYIHQLAPKTYRAYGVFGGKTDTGDHTTVVTEQKHIDSDFQNLSNEEMETFLRSEFLGDYWQSPHAVSATKFQGKRLYVHALEGKKIEKEKVKREIFDLTVHRYVYPELEFSVTVSSGTYVRSLFEEMSVLMGGHGALLKLYRTAVGPNTIDQAMRPVDWPKKGEAFDLLRWGKPLDQVLRLNKVHLSQAQTKKYVQGIRFLFQDVQATLVETGIVDSLELWWVYSADGVLIGLARQGETTQGKELQAIFNLTLSIALFS